MLDSGGNKCTEAIFVDPLNEIVWKRHGAHSNSKDKLGLSCGADLQRRAVLSHAAQAEA